MTDIAQNISRLKHEIEQLSSQKQSYKRKIEEIESDLNHHELSKSQKDQLISLKNDLEDDLENASYALNSTEERLSHLIGHEDAQYNIVDETENVLEQVRNEYGELQNKNQSIEEKIRNIDETHTKIKELEDTARGLLKRSTSAALGEQFAGRKNELESNLKYWKYASIGSIVLLLASSIAIYYDIVASSSGAIANLSKIALILPVSVTVWFSVSNYSRQKRLMEEYEFKARMALSVTGFKEVIQEETTEENDDMVAEFMVDTMEKIYSNPQQNILSNEEPGTEDPLTTGQRPLVDAIKKIGQS